MRAKDWGRKGLYALTIKSRESIKAKRSYEIHGWI